ncbi:MAG TPA: PA2169 family four-helix-bundle protein, partial [Terriglobales bacterium]|nr:PA2169 family four-helix-bundle protein [Terriglobales bacterium]
LQDLAKTCRDGEKGYKEAADHAKSSELKSHFLQISSERGRFASQLESALADVSKDVTRNEGHAVAAVHRAWIDIKEALGGGDHAILAWLEQGDDYAKGKYE